MIFIKSTSFQNTRWLLLFYNSCLLYTLQLVALYSISQGFYRFRFLFSFLFFCFVWQMSVYLVSYAKRVLYSDQPTVFLARRYLNTMILNNFEILNSILNSFQETHDFLVLTDPVIIFIYLWTTDIFVTVCYPASKLLKCDLVQTLNNFWNPFLRIFAADLLLIYFWCYNFEITDPSQQLHV